MTIITDVEDAWNAAIWQHATIQAYTSKINKFEITTDSEKEVQLLRHNQQTNFIEAVTKCAIIYGRTSSNIGRVATFQFTVEVNYYRELDTTGDNYRSIRDFYLELFDLVHSELSDNWTNTVDFWFPEQEAPTIVEVLINNKKCWKGTHRYFAEKNADYSIA